MRTVRFKEEGCAFEVVLTCDMPWHNGPNTPVSYGELDHQHLSAEMRIRADGWARVYAQGAQLEALVACSGCVAVALLRAVAAEALLKKDVVSEKAPELEAMCECGECFVSFTGESFTCSDCRGVFAGCHGPRANETKGRALCAACAEAAEAEESPKLAPLCECGGCHHTGPRSFRCSNCTGLFALCHNAHRKDAGGEYICAACEAPEAAKEPPKLAQLCVCGMCYMPRGYFECYRCGDEFALCHGPEEDTVGAFCTACAETLAPEVPDTGPKLVRCRDCDYLSCRDAGGGFCERPCGITPVASPHVSNDGLEAGHGCTWGKVKS